MDAKMKKARKITGIAKFEKNCACGVNHHNRKAKKYTIGGTYEHGKWCMLKAETLRVYNSLA